MPKFVSKAQQALFFAKARRGEVPLEEVKKRAVGGKAFKKLPRYKRKRKSASKKRVNSFFIRKNSK